MVRMYLKIPKKFLRLIFLGRILGCAYNIFCMVKLTFLAQFLVNPFSTQSCLVLYSFCANLLHSLIIWGIISSLSPHYYCYHYYQYYYLLIRVFHICISLWFFTGVWVTASFLKSPGLFSVFWPFSIILLFG